MPKLQAVLFDFDGTIFHTEGVHQQAVREVFEAEFHEPVDEAESRSLIGLTYEERLLKMFARRGLDDDLLVERLEAEARKLMRARLDMGRSLVPGVSQLMRALQSAGVAMAVVTSAAHDRVLQCLDEVGLADVLAVVVGRGDVQNLKPDPEPYQKALAELAVAPDVALVFEDSPAGIASALAAGLAVVGLTTTYTGPDLVGARLTVPNFTGLTIAKLEALL